MMRVLKCLIFVVVVGCSSRAVRPQDPPTQAMERDLDIERACQVVDPTVLPACQVDDENWRPSSRLLDSAIEAYGHKDYARAMPLLTDVIGGKGNDDGCGVQRAVFYRAKLLYRLGRYNESFGEFVRFVQAGPDSFYHAATARWIAAFKDKLPAASLDRCLDRYRSMCPLM